MSSKSGYDMSIQEWYIISLQTRIEARISFRKAPKRRDSPMAPSEILSHPIVKEEPWIENGNSWAINAFRYRTSTNYMRP